MNTSEIFNSIYSEGKWQEGDGPRSGPGSAIANSRPVLEFLEEANPSSVCDIGCGDLTFMRDYLEKKAGQISYTGIDISTEALKIARSPWIPGTVFLIGDVTEPGFEAHADVIVIKDALMHMWNLQLVWALKNLSRCTYNLLITNTDPGVSDERDLNGSAHWAMADLEGPLFGPYLAKLGTIVAREPRPAHGSYIAIRRTNI
jgi:SAM-dependent methyltransferase